MEAGNKCRYVLCFRSLADGYKSSFFLQFGMVLLRCEGTMNVVIADVLGLVGGGDAEDGYCFKVFQFTLFKCYGVHETRLKVPGTNPHTTTRSSLGTSKQATSNGR